MSEKIGLFIMAGLYFVAGVNHFLKPKIYLKIMPPYLPKPELLNYLSGLAEIILAIGLLFEPSRKVSAWGVIALLVAIYPANLYMWTSKMKLFNKVIPTWGHILRLFAQLALIYWAYVYTL